MATRMMAIMGVAAAAVLVSACSSSSVGIGLPNAFIYRDTTTPLRWKAPNEPGPQARRAAEVRRAEVTAWYVEPNIPGVPGTQGGSVGWGNIGIERAMEKGEMDHILYADARTIQILRIVTRSTIIAYGVDQETADAWEAEDEAERPGPPRESR